MDQTKTGRLIRALRQGQNLTQAELGEKLGVGGKAVSKWECGAGAPDIALLPRLSELLGVDTEALLRGELGENDRSSGNLRRTRFYVCPDCGAKHEIFGASRADGLAALHGIPNVAKLPIDPRLAACSDGGLMEVFSGDGLDGRADALEKL